MRARRTASSRGRGVKVLDKYLAQAYKYPFQVRLTGRTETAYISKETPMVSYLNVSFAIETLRQQYEKVRFYVLIKHVI